ncbi:hypothetical protein [Consotaella aegiceratis]|uniref:hypothetical protein n=1 Tax=Consotaella aegiceratis TaxID=3097961 RepID=UPI002F3E5A5F
MAKLTRAERKERKALAKATVAVLKTSARSYKWRVARDSLFKDHNGRFVEVQASIVNWAYKTRMAARIKPMALDPVFWNIVGMPENAKLPLSFRAFGAWVCSAPTVVEDEINEGDGSPETLAANILDWANSQMASPMLTADCETYLEYLQTLSKGYFANRVAMLCLMGRYEDARAACLAAIEQDDSGGFGQLVNDKIVNFPTMVIHWLDRNGQ